MDLCKGAVVLWLKTDDIPRIINPIVLQGVGFFFHHYEQRRVAERESVESHVCSVWPCT